jgi:hypothetical protein
LMLGFFILEVLRFVLRRAHGEAARRDHDHLGAGVAFLEAVQRLERALALR